MAGADGGANGSPVAGVRVEQSTALEWNCRELGLLLQGLARSLREGWPVRLEEVEVLHGKVQDMDVWLSQVKENEL